MLDQATVSAQVPVQALVQAQVRLAELAWALVSEMVRVWGWVLALGAARVAALALEWGPEEVVPGVV